MKRRYSVVDENDDVYEMWDSSLVSAAERFRQHHPTTRFVVMLWREIVPSFRDAFFYAQMKDRCHLSFMTSEAIS